MPEPQGGVDLIDLVSIAGSLAILAFILLLIRRRRLRERYALLWLAFGAVLLLFSAWRGLIDILADWFHVYYAPALLFLVFTVLLSLIALHLTVVISHLSERTRNLTQELALLREEMERRTRA